LIAVALRQLRRGGGRQENGMIRAALKAFEKPDVRGKLWVAEGCSSKKIPRESIC